jgi:regulation of enolase protein 1 (concanavalin A-like superfamily)
MVLLQDYASLPLSSVTSGAYPSPINFASQLARVNFLRSEPSIAPSSSFRFFVSDLNRSLYILDKAGKTFTPYINFEEVFPKFDNAPGYSGGLVTFAFGPDYATNGTFYTVHLEDPAKSGSAVPTNTSLPGFDLSGAYTTTGVMNPPAGTSVRQAILVEWMDTNIIDSTFQGTAREIMRVGFAANYHPIGDLIFNPTAHPGDPDYGNLYVAIGDGFAGETPGATHSIPQRLDAVQGKILRITPGIRAGDLVGANGRYSIPSTGSDPNPFVSVSLANLKPEIYAYGFRNPHRMSWDPISNALIVNDIGLNAWEEVDVVTKGANYGYAEREGDEQLFISSGPSLTGSQTNPPTPFPNPDTMTVAGIAAPVAPTYPAMAYSHEDGDAMSSGFVYRGTQIPYLRGKYIFGDITTGRIFYSDLTAMLASTRTSPAPIHEIQIVYSSPYNGLGPVNRRLYDIVADAYASKGGDSNPSSSMGVLPGVQTVVGGFSGSIFIQGRLDIDLVRYGGGRADIRVVEGGDGEVYVLSKSDGMIRSMLPQVDPAPVGPTIVTPPQSIVATVGDNVSLSVTATGTAPLAYQWRKGGTGDIPGATTSTLNLNNVQQADTGSTYDVVVTNTVSSVTSSLATLVLNPLPPVPAPTGLTATAGNTQVVLTWTGAAGATGYNVKRSATNGGPYATVAPNVATTSYTNTGLSNGTTYYYVVSTVSGSRESVNSSQAFATPTAPPGLPGPWQTRDIGAVAAAGSASSAGGTFSVTGSGADIYGTLDEFRYVYQPASGDCDITARVVGVQNTDPWAEAGVMIRETLNSNSKHVSAFVTSANGVARYRRTSTGGYSSYSRTTGLTAPYWVRVVRSSNTFTAYRSANGTTWTSMGSVTVTMGANVFIGLAVTSHRDGTLNTSTIDTVTATP